MQPTFDFNVSIPVAGRSPRARHASHSGSLRAAAGRPQLTVAYLALLKSLGPLSDHEAAHALGRMVSSINSTRNGLGEHIVPSDQFEVTPWGSKRVRWRVAP